MNGLAEFDFFVRFDDDEPKVEIVGRDQVVARTLAASIALEADEPVTCTWDGLGRRRRARSQPGRYRLAGDASRARTGRWSSRSASTSSRGAKAVATTLSFGEPCEPEEEE